MHHKVPITNPRYPPNAYPFHHTSPTPQPQAGGLSPPTQLWHVLSRVCDAVVRAKSNMTLLRSTEHKACEWRVYILVVWSRHQCACNESVAYRSWAATHAPALQRSHQTFAMATRCAVAVAMSVAVWHKHTIHALSYPGCCLCRCNASESKQRREHIHCASAERRGTNVVRR